MLSRSKVQLQAKRAAGNGDDCDDEAKITRKVKSVSLMSLVALGVGATISKLTTALPIEKPIG